MHSTIKISGNFLRYAVTIFSSETITYFMQLHLPYFSWDSSQYACAAFKHLGIIYFMQLQFWRFSELISQKFLEGWYKEEEINGKVGTRLPKKVVTRIFLGDHRLSKGC